MLWSWLSGHGANHAQERLMNKDQIEGLAEEDKGKVKKAAGVMLDDENLEAERNIQMNFDKVQSSFGELKEDIKKGTDDIKNKYPWS
jgi:uncharacterized protein YjbJ (UPF0337 family)